MSKVPVFLSNGTEKKNCLAQDKKKIDVEEEASLKFVEATL
jgi:hypothetical protein